MIATAITLIVIVVIILVFAGESAHYNSYPLSRSSSGLKCSEADRRHERDDAARAKRSAK